MGAMCGFTFEELGVVVEDLSPISSANPMTFSISTFSREEMDIRDFMDNVLSQGPNQPVPPSIGISPSQYFIDNPNTWGS